MVLKLKVLDLFIHFFLFNILLGNECDSITPFSKILEKKRDDVMQTSDLFIFSITILLFFFQI